MKKKLTEKNWFIVLMMLTIPLLGFIFALRQKKSTRLHTILYILSLVVWLLVYGGVHFIVSFGLVIGIVIHFLA